MENSKDRHFVIIVPPGDFRQYTRRFHYEALAKFAEVAIVPFPASFIRWFIKYRKSAHPALTTGKLTVAANAVGLPKKLYSRYGIFHKLQNFLIRRHIGKHLRKNSIVILMNDHMWPFWQAISDKKVILELTDAWWLMERVDPRKRAETFANFAGLLMASNLVFCSSLNLVQFARHFNQNVYYIPNTSKIPDGVNFRRPGKKIIFGFLGNINEWIDLALVERLCRNLNDCEIRFVGAINGASAFRSQFDELMKKNLLKYDPAVPTDKIFDKIAEFDVGIIPHRLSQFNSYVYPNKLIQYLACGKPVISTNFALDLDNFRGHIYIADTPEEFLAHAKRFVSGDIEINRELFERLREVAIQNSVEERAKLRLKYIGSDKSFGRAYNDP